jgi:hypothetical protein
LERLAKNRSNRFNPEARVGVKTPSERFGAAARSTGVALAVWAE